MILNSATVSVFFLAGVLGLGSQQAPPPQNAGPDTTTATFGDWTLRCRLTSTAQSSSRSCELVQSVVLQGQAAPIAQLAFGRLAPGKPLFLTAVLPNNVTFPSAVRISIDEKDARPVELEWTRCLPAGCFASREMNDAMIARWRAESESGRLVFKNGAGQDTVLPISFRGLARALDALGKD